MKRRWALAAALAMAAMAGADRAIFSPVGTVVREGRAAVSHIGGPDLRQESTWFAYGPSIGWEIGVEARGLRRSDAEAGIDAAYSLLSPVVDLSPGLAFGVQDALGELPEGRRVWLAAVWDVGNDGRHNQDIPTRVTTGFVAKRGGRWFGSVRLPFSRHFSLTAEHDGFEPAASLDVSPFQGLAVRAIFRDGRNLLGVRADLAF
jgi:hypothetical protein